MANLPLNPIEAIEQILNDLSNKAINNNQPEPQVINYLEEVHKQYPMLKEHVAEADIEHLLETMRIAYRLYRDSKWHSLLHNNCTCEGFYRDPSCKVH